MSFVGSELFGPHPPYGMGVSDMVRRREYIDRLGEAVRYSRISSYDAQKCLDNYDVERRINGLTVDFRQFEPRQYASKPLKENEWAISYEGSTATLTKKKDIQGIISYFYSRK